MENIHFRLANDNNSLIFDGQLCKIENGVFKDKNKIYHHIYNMNTMLRTHTSVCEYKDFVYKMPCIISSKWSRIILGWFSNICKQFVEVSGYESYKSVPFKETMENIKDCLSDMFKSKIGESMVLEQRPDLVESLYAYITMMFDTLDEETIAKSLNTTDAITVRIGPENGVYGNVKNENETFQDMVNYITAYITLDHSIVEYVSCSYTPFVIFNLFYILLLEKGTFEDNVEKDKTELFMNSILSLFMDITTDRITTELFIKEKNSTMKNIKRSYYKMFPFLRKYNNKFDFKENEIKTIFDKSKQSINDIMMFPYVLVWNFTEKCRVQFIYDHYKNLLTDYSNRENQINDASGIISKLPDAETFWNVLQKMAQNMDNCRYDVDTFSKELVHIIG